MILTFLNTIFAADFTILKKDFKAPRNISPAFISYRFDIYDGFDFVSLNSESIKLIDDKKLEISGPITYKGMQKIYYTFDNKQTKSSCLLFNDKLFDTSRIHLLELAIKLNYILKSSECERRDILSKTLGDKSFINIVLMLLSEPFCYMKSRNEYFKIFINLLVSLVNRDGVNKSSFNEFLDVKECDFYNLNYEISRKLEYINYLIPFNNLFCDKMTKKISQFLSK